MNKLYVAPEPDYILRNRLVQSKKIGSCFSRYGNKATAPVQIVEQEETIQDLLKELEVLNAQKKEIFAEVVANMKKQKDLPIVTAPPKPKENKFMQVMKQRPKIEMKRFDNRPPGGVNEIYNSLKCTNA